MTAADLEISHSVELEIMVNGKKTTLLTAVEKVLDQTVLLAPIRIDGKLLGFPPTCSVQFIYPQEDHVYCWPNVIVKAVRHENKAYHCVTLLTEATTINRRGSYRVFIGQEMLVTTFTSQGPKPLRCLIKDVSEGGFAFFSKEQFDIGRTVRLNLATKGGELHIGAQIVRVQGEEGQTEVLYGCKFLEKNPLLSKLLMKLQQEHQRQKMGF